MTEKLIKITFLKVFSGVVLC